MGHISGVRRVVAIAIAVFTFCSCSGDDTDNGSAQVLNPILIRDRDVLVVADDDDIDGIVRELDDSEEVAEYAVLFPGVAPSLLIKAEELDECGGPRRGVLVDMRSDGTDLATALPTDAEVYRWLDLFPYDEPVDFDVEVYLDVDAGAEVVAAIRDELADDDRVDEFEHLDQGDAYEEFKKIFANEPDLIDQTTPEDLPESFRIRVADDASADALAADYQSRRGVSSVHDGTRPEQDDLDALLATQWDIDFDEKAEIFMQLGATADEVDGLRDLVEADSSVRSYEYLDQEAALREFARLFEDTPELVESTSAPELPASFRLVVEDGTDSAVIERRYESAPGVDNVLAVFDHFCF